MSNRAKSPQAQTLPVYRGVDVRVSEGANLGDALSFADDLMLDDVYSLRPQAGVVQLAIEAAQKNLYRIAPESPLGQAGALVHLDCALTLMTPDGQTTDALVLVETDSEGAVAETYLLPFAAMVPRMPYALVGIEPDVAPSHLAQLSCARFSRGTRMTMASGRQKAVEDLRVGDRLLTRDDGPQEIRWIGHSTLRATGAFAPICIKAGTLNNSADLIVSPDHRLFIYQRQDHLGAGRAELMVKARHLVNDDSVVVQDGGFVDYFQLLFDSHQIIYAEGIAAESMLIDTRTRPAVPAEVAAKLDAGNPQSDLSGLDVQEALLKRPDAADLLRRASSR